MTNHEELGWPARFVGELDHRLLRAPTLKLRSARTGPYGETIYCVDLRLRRPNADDYLPPAAQHSFEHFLLEGLQRLLPEHFVSVGVMGCGTGFYLVLRNEGRSDRLSDVLAQVCTGVLAASEVPYANEVQCGNWRNHDLAQAQALARELLAARGSWLQAA